MGMALIVVLIGFTLLSAAGLAGFAAESAVAAAPVVADSVVFSCKGAGLPASAGAPADLSPADVGMIVAGDVLFKNNCAQCHAVNEQVVGPALAGIRQRRPVSWLIPWVKNSSKVVASGDDYAVALFNKYSKQQMPSFTLSNKEITAILAYVASQEGMAVAVR
ncbi:cytochrome c [Hymenobacter sp. BT662]|uniref:Cytochrome c n=2 Tax=Hymenobacter ruricola TaxID=2791023 RepID=A0ABS0IAV0_9BACT|nr:cytochrome c [Hymenobacter ruricola]